MKGISEEKALPQRRRPLKAPHGLRFAACILKKSLFISFIRGKIPVLPKPPASRLPALNPHEV
jgi:hypothetical protein